MKLYKLIAQTVAWKPNANWEHNRDKLLVYIQKSLLPSGSGIDCGTKLCETLGKNGSFKLTLEFHHMNENGMYDGWTQHEIIVKPDLQFEFVMDIRGKDRNQIKDYLGDIYDACLREEVDDEKLKKELWK